MKRTNRFIIRFRLLVQLALLPLFSGVIVVHGTTKTIKPDTKIIDDDEGTALLVVTTLVPPRRRKDRCIHDAPSNTANSVGLQQSIINGESETNTQHVCNQIMTTAQVIRKTQHNKAKELQQNEVTYYIMIESQFICSFSLLSFVFLLMYGMSYDSE